MLTAPVPVFLEAASPRLFGLDHYRPIPDDNPLTQARVELGHRAWGKSFFWDGRAATLEDQVMQPILHPDELA